MPGYVAVSTNLYGTTAGTIKSVYSLPANAAGNAAEVNYTLVTGANTITVPSWANGAVIVPPPGNVQTLTLKGVSGDTGIVISENSASELTFQPGSVPASFVLTAGGNFTNPTIIIFY